MERYYDMWRSVFEAFSTAEPKYYDDMVDWYPSGHLEITVKLRDGRRLTYNLMNDTTRFIPVSEDDTEELNEDQWRSEFGRRLRNRIISAGLHQDKVSELTGISRVSLSKYMNGKALPSAYNLSRIARVLKCSAGELTDI